MTLALDGHATGSASAASIVSATLTTSSANDVIVAIVATAAAALKTVSFISGSGITWEGSARKRLTLSSTNDLELWYGTASSPLSAVSIGATLSGTASHAFMTVFGVSGADTTAIFDSNASLPAVNTGSNGVRPFASNISTTSASTMIIMGTAELGNLTQTAGAVEILIDAVASSTLSIGSEYVITAAPQSSISPEFGALANTTWGLIADAIVAAPIPPPSFPMNSMRRVYLRR